MTSLKYRPGPVDGEIGEAVARAQRMDREAVAYATRSLFGWLSFHVVFPCVAFVFHALILYYHRGLGIEVTWDRAVQVQALLLIGLIVCGTILERLSVFGPRSPETESGLRSLGSCLYVICAMVLAVTYALSIDPRVLAGDPAVGAGGTEFVASNQGWILATIVLLIAGSAVIYWLVHYRASLRRGGREGAVDGVA